MGARACVKASQRYLIDRVFAVGRTSTMFVVFASIGIIEIRGTTQRATDSGETVRS